jgi:hypothetical protein
LAGYSGAAAFAGYSGAGVFAGYAGKDLGEFLA